MVKYRTSLAGAYLSRQSGSSTGGARDSREEARLGGATDKVPQSTTDHVTPKIFLAQTASATRLTDLLCLYKETAHPRLALRGITHRKHSSVPQTTPAICLPGLLSYANNPCDITEGNNKPHASI